MAFFTLSKSKFNAFKWAMRLAYSEVFWQTSSATRFGSLLPFSQQKRQNRFLLFSRWTICLRNFDCGILRCVLVLAVFFYFGSKGSLEINSFYFRMKVDFVEERSIGELFILFYYYILKIPTCLAIIIITIWTARPISVNAVFDYSTTLSNSEAQYFYFPHLRQSVID